MGQAAVPVTERQRERGRRTCGVASGRGGLEGLLDGVVGLGELAGRLLTETSCKDERISSACGGGMNVSG
jgi:hypothetical protein